MLRITKLADYATLVMTVLAAHPDQTLSATELAEQSGLEPPTVSKLLKPLAQAGLVKSIRGVRGGYRLNRQADEINLADIVETMDGPLALTECSLDSHRCAIVSHCRVRHNWRRINTALVEVLRNVSLAHLSQTSIADSTPWRASDPHIAN